MTAVQAYTTGCRNSPGNWGKDRTVFRSCRGSRGDPCDPRPGVCKWLVTSRLPTPVAQVFSD